MGITGWEQNQILITKDLKFLATWRFQLIDVLAVCN